MQMELHFRRAKWNGTKLGNQLSAMPVLAMCRFEILQLYRFRKSLVGIFADRQLSRTVHYVVKDHGIYLYE